MNVCHWKPGAGADLTGRCHDCGHAVVVHVGVDRCATCELRLHIDTLDALARDIDESKDGMQPLADGSAYDAMVKVSHWAVLLTGWQLGTRADGDAESDAVRDQRKLLIMLRLEVSAIVDMMIRCGVVTQQQWEASVERSAKDLDRAYADRFPGVQSTEVGLSMDPKAVMKAGWMKGWRP